MTEIATLDPHDEPALHDWFAAEQASIRDDRPQAATRTFGALANGVRNPNPYVCAGASVVRRWSARSS